EYRRGNDAIFVSMRLCHRRPSDVRTSGHISYSATIKLDNDGRGDRGPNFQAGRAKASPDFFVFSKGRPLWRMWLSSARSGATRAKARLWIGLRTALTSLCASMADTMPATRWSLTA